MASSLASQKALSNLVVKYYDLDPGDTAANAIGWEAIESECLLVSFMNTVGTSDITLTINAAVDSSGTSSTIVKSASATNPNAVFDYNFLEVLAEEVAQQGATSGLVFTHWSGVVTMATGTDEGIGGQIEYNLHNPRLNATADSIA